MPIYEITESIVYHVKASSPKQAEKKLLKHVRAFHNDDLAQRDGVEFIDVSNRDVSRLPKRPAPLCPNVLDLLNGEGGAS